MDKYDTDNVMTQLGLSSGQVRYLVMTELELSSRHK